MASTKDEPRPKTSSTGNPAGPEDRGKNVTAPARARNDLIQGEGNYDAARQFDEAERKFVASGKVAAAARAAAPKSEAEEREMLAAEAEGKRRAKEEDPALVKPWGDSTISKVPGKPRP